VPKTAHLMREAALAHQRRAEAARLFQAAPLRRAPLSVARPVGKPSIIQAMRAKMAREAAAAASARARSAAVRSHALATTLQEVDF